MTKPRRRRPARLMSVAAAVAVGLVVAGVSYSAGVSRGPYGTAPSTTADAADSALIVIPQVGRDLAARGDKAMTGAAAGAGEPTTPYAAADGVVDSAASGVAAGAPVGDRTSGGSSAGSSSSSYAQGWQQNRFVFHDGGLSSVGGEAEGWGLDAASAYSKASVTALADQLGIDGSASKQNDTWSVGPQDGSNANVSIYPDGSVSSNDPAKDVASGKKAPSNEKALEQSNELLTTMGLDPASFRLTADDNGGTDMPYTWVTGYQLLGGSPNGLSWSFTVTSEGVSSAYGSLATPVSLGTYPVVSPSEAFARLTDSRFAASTWPSAYPAAVQDSWTASAQQEDAKATWKVPPLARPGDKLTWAVADTTITKAHLGLSTYYENDGAVLVLPTYELGSADGGLWTVIAVADSELQF